MASRSYPISAIKVLFGSAGNQCAHPDCTNPLIAPATGESDEAVLAQICHIYAASDNGPRGKPGLTQEERNSTQNLILMCGVHHPMVDKQYETFSADLLKEWKRLHEAKFQQGTAEAIRQQEKSQQFTFTTGLTNQQIEAEILRIRQARGVNGYPTIEKAKALALNVERLDLAGGSREVRAHALAFCARMLSRGEDLDRAKALLEKSRQLAESSEFAFAKAFIVAADASASAPGLALLAPLNTRASRSAMLGMVNNERGPEGALNWVQDAGLQLSSFDSEGKLTLIINEQITGRWEDAYAHVQTLDAADFEETPLLNYAAANALLAKAVPPALRSQMIFQTPFDAAGIPLADDDQALIDRKRAITFYEVQAKFAQECGVLEAAKLANEMALLLRLRDADQHDKAMDTLRQFLRDDSQSLRYVPLAMQFGIKVDLNAIERRINERVALTGRGSIDEAVARMALALTKGS